MGVCLVADVGQESFLTDEERVFRLGLETGRTRVVTLIFLVHPHHVILLFALVSVRKSWVQNESKRIIVVVKVLLVLC